MSQELTERVQHIKVAKMASVANTLPWVLASWREERNKQSCKKAAKHRVQTAMHFQATYFFYLADDGVVGGSNSVEDPFDALQLLLVAGGDSIKGLIVVLQSTTALTAGNEKWNLIITCISPYNNLLQTAAQLHLHVKGVRHLHVSHLHQSGEVHLLLHLPVTPNLHRGVSGLQLRLREQTGMSRTKSITPQYKHTFES